MLVMLGVVWSMKQPPSKVENISAPSAEVVKGNMEADTRRKADASRLKAEQDAATRREAEATKARQDADALRKAEEARLIAEKDAATRRVTEAAKAKQEADARQKVEAARLKAEKDAARRVAEQEKKLKIGAEYGGGKIAWLDATGQHGLIAAKTDLSGRYSCESAKKACQDLTVNDYSDWQLPTTDELNKLYHAKSVVGGFADDYYWSSTEYGAYNALNQNFYDGSKNDTNKYRVFSLVRAVRAF